MIKFLIGVFVFVFVVPSVLFSIWAHFEEKKAAKNRKPPRPLTHAQMMALLEPDGIPATAAEEEKPAAAQPASMPAEPPEEQPVNIQNAPHEVQTIVMKREIYY